VAGYLARRAFDHDAKLIVVDDSDTELDGWANQRMKLDAIAHNGSSPFALLRYTYHLRQDGISKVRSAVMGAERPVVLYGPNLSTAVYAALRGLPEKVKFLPLVEGSNAAGAARFGISVRRVQGDVLYVLAADEIPDGQDLPRAAFTVVQSAYRTRWTEAADAVLPARVWTEKKGHVVNMEGRELPVVALTEAPKGVPADWDTLARLAALLGTPALYRSMSEVQGSL
jgi:NADH-quinone oxidoreductase subunit G